LDRFLGEPPDGLPKKSAGGYRLLQRFPWSRRDVLPEAGLFLRSPKVCERLERPAAFRDGNADILPRGHGYAAEQGQVRRVRR
jgi:hypothetical protein